MMSAAHYQQWQQNQANTPITNHYQQMMQFRANTPTTDPYQQMMQFRANTPRPYNGFQTTPQQKKSSSGGGAPSPPNMTAYAPQQQPQGGYNAYAPGTAQPTPPPSQGTPYSSYAAPQASGRTMAQAGSDPRAPIPSDVPDFWVDSTGQTHGGQRPASRGIPYGTDNPANAARNDAQWGAGQWAYSRAPGNAPPRPSNTAFVDAYNQAAAAGPEPTRYTPAYSTTGQGRNYSQQLGMDGVTPVGKPVDRGVGNEGNYAYMPDGYRPSPFQAQYQNIDGSLSGQPAVNDRDALINRLNQNLTPYITGERSGPPQYDIPQLFGQAQEDVAAGWRNPFNFNQPQGTPYPSDTMYTGGSPNFDESTGRYRVPRPQQPGQSPSRGTPSALTTAPRGGYAGPAVNPAEREDYDPGTGWFRNPLSPSLYLPHELAAAKDESGNVDYSGLQGVFSSPSQRWTDMNYNDKRLKTFLAHGDRTRLHGLLAELGEQDQAGYFDQLLARLGQPGRTL